MAGRTFSDEDVAGLCFTREGECGKHDGQMGFDAVAEARSTTAQSCGTEDLPATQGRLVSRVLGAHLAAVRRVGPNRSKGQCREPS